MASFSVGEAATAGFGVIARKPLAVLAWGLLLLVATAAPMYLLLWFLRPDFALLMQMGAQEGSSNDPNLLPRLIRMQSGMMLFQLLFWLWSTGVKAVICSAVFRAVLEPKESRWAYLRLGPQEGWLTLLFLVEYVLAYIAIFIVALLGMVLVAIVGVGAGGNSVSAMFGTGIVVGLAALGLFLWLALKLSMAAPMTFVDRQFRLFESWNFLIGIEVLFCGLVIGGLFALGGQMSWLFEPGAIHDLLRETPNEIVRKLGPAIGIAGTLLVAFSAVVSTVCCAPWAAAYRALRGEATTSA
jgi:hypothetical protein